MSLTTPYGRISRADVIERAKQLYCWGMPWGEAMRKAHREAAEELRARFNPHSHIQISKEDAA